MRSLPALFYTQSLLATAIIITLHLSARPDPLIASKCLDRNALQM